MSESRRKFLKTLGALPLAGALGGMAQASSSSLITTHSPPRFLLNRFSIAGFQYYDGPILLYDLDPGEELICQIDYRGGIADEFLYRGTHGVRGCAHNHEGHEGATKHAKKNPGNLLPGCELTLKAEPENPHDPFAVEIYFEQIKLGYIPRSDNKHLHRLLAQGAKLECRVIEVDPEAGVWNMVRVEVTLFLGYGLPWVISSNH